MGKQARVHDPVSADGRFQLEVLGLRWLLIALYAFFTYLGSITVARPWFLASEGFLVGFHIYYTWYVWHELTRKPLPPQAAYATPFLDTVAVSLALVAVGDPLHPIWAVYFFIMVGVGFYYYPVARVYLIWLVLSYAMVGVGLRARNADFAISQMVIAGSLLFSGMFNIISYTTGERRLIRRITEVARTDPLTNLLNRRGLEETLRDQLEGTAERGECGLTVFMIDVDRFKRYNDQYGHLAADGVLEQLGEILRSATREEDIVARYGGDEFVIILPNVAVDDALRMADRLRLQIARLGLCKVSIGVGIAHSREAADELLNRADAALLEAKHAGRDCVRVAAPIAQSGVAA